MALTKVSGDILDTGIVVAGIVTATEFVGAGLSISGISTFVGVATFKDNAYVDKELYVGGIKINTGGGTVAIGTDIVTRNIKATGLSTFVGDAQFDGDVSIGGTLTYQDVTNIDSVGLGTFRNGIHVTAGVSTFLGGVKIGPTNTNTRAGVINIGGAGALSYSDNDGSSGNMATVLLENTYGAANSDIHIKQRGDLEVQNLAGHAILRVDTTWTSSSVNSGNVYLNYKSNTSGSSLLTRLSTTSTGVDIDTGDLHMTGGGQVGIADTIFHLGDTNTKIRFPAADTFAVETAGDERLRITSTGQILVGTIAHGGTYDGVTPDFVSEKNSTYQAHTLVVNSNHAGQSSILQFVKSRGTSDGANTIVQDDDRLGSIYGIGADGTNRDSAAAAIDFRVDGTVAANRMPGRIEFRTTSDSAGAVVPTERLRITSAGNLKLPDNGKIEFGGAQDVAGDLSIYHDGSNSYIRDQGTGYLRLDTDGVAFQVRSTAGVNMIASYTAGATGVELYHGGNSILKTNANGITVTGEVAASQDYPNIRPVLDFNFAATKKLDPRMKFYSTGESSYHDGVGSVKFVPDNEPRFEHDIVTGECKGLMFETAGTNYSYYSRRFDTVASGSWVPQNGGATPTVTANTHTAPDGTSSGIYMADTISGATGTAFNGNVVQQQHTAGANVKHTFSIYIKLITSTQATIYIRDGGTGSVSSASAIPNTRNWQRVVVTSSAALTNSTVHSFYFGNTNGTIAVWGSQIERSDYVSSYIKTEAGANGTRTADNGGVRLDGEDVTDIFNQGQGTLIAEVIPTLAEANQGIVGFYQDFGSVNRIELRAMGTNTANARFESVVGSSSVASMTGSAHSGVGQSSKYAYAFQENNYASTVNGGTVATDTSGAFPHGTGINSMIIGDTVYAKDHAIIIKRVMYYADRLSNNQLVTLTS